MKFELTAGCSLISLAMPKARVFSREPYIVGIFTTGDAEIVVSCEPLRGIKRGRPFVGNIRLVPPTLLGEYVVGSIEVWESDAGFRNFGERLAHALQLVERSGTLSKLVDAAGTLAIGPARIGIKQASAQIAEALVGNRDDFVAGFEFDIETWQLAIGDTFQLTSPKCSMMLMVSDDETTQETPTQSNITAGGDVAGGDITKVTLAAGDILEALGQGDSDLLDAPALVRDAGLDLGNEQILEALRSWQMRDGTKDGLEALMLRWKT